MACNYTLYVNYCIVCVVYFWFTEQRFRYCELHNVKWQVDNEKWLENDVEGHGLKWGTDKNKKNLPAGYSVSRSRSKLHISGIQASSPHARSLCYEVLHKQLRAYVKTEHFCVQASTEKHCVVVAAFINSISFLYGLDSGIMSALAAQRTLVSQLVTSLPHHTKQEIWST